MSTAQQVPGVLNRYFGEVPAVSILRIEYGKLSAFKRVRWERASNGEGKRAPRFAFADQPEYPHLYAHLEGENIESFKEIEKGPGNWDASLKSIADWLK